MSSIATVYHKGVEYKVVRQLRSCCRSIQYIVEDPKTGKREVIKIPRR
jgi:hypothetical protein